MARQWIISFLLAGLTSVTSFSQDTDNDVRIRSLVKEYGQAEAVLRLTARSEIDNLSRHVSILDVRGDSVILSLSPRDLNWFIGRHYAYTIREQKMPRGLVSASSLAKALTWDAYPTYAQYDSLMQSFISTYPDLCTLDTIGTSINGKLVLALRITAAGATSETRPEVFYTSTMHGNETGGYILMLRLADYLLRNYPADSRVKDLVDNLRIWINPLANPDGTYNSGNIISNPVRYNANGVDLNRNFPDPLQTDNVLEKENTDMVNFMKKHRFVISANFHSGVEVVNYPWDRWLNKLHADNAWFNEISRAYADTVHVYSPTGYMTYLENGVTRGAVWYVVYGGRQDYVTQQLHGREVTIEVDDQYITPASQLPALWESNRRSLLGYLENALYGVHGQVSDSTSGLPVVAKVFIDGHDKDTSEVYSDTEHGLFVRMLSPGIWPFTFSAKGYRDTSVYVTVYTGQRTDLNIVLKKKTQSDTVNTALLYPNPATSSLNALVPVAVAGDAEILITDQAGRLVIGYTTEIVSGTPVIIDISGLSPGIYQAEFRNSRKRAFCRGRFIVIK